MKRKFDIGLAVVLAGIAVLHIFRLGHIPPGLSNDEANIGYEAWSIATTGKDQWGNFLPVVFEGFGNWSLPVYIYVLSPFIRIFGPTIIAVRLLSAISAVVLAWLAYLLVKELQEGEDQGTALLASALVGITPWIFGLTRIANEVTLSTVFFLGALIFFLKSRRKRSLIIGAVACAVISMLTYYGMWLFLPLFFVSVIARSPSTRLRSFDSEGRALRLRLDEIYDLRRGNLSSEMRLPHFARQAGSLAMTFKKSSHYLVVTLLIGFLVFMLLLISLKQGGNKRLSQVNIFNDPALVGTLNEKRGACQEVYPDAACKIFFNRPTLYLSTYISNYASHFSLREWFIAGGNGGILPPGGFFLLIQAPLVLLGLWAILGKGNAREKLVYGSWILLSPVADSLTSSGNFARSFLLAPAFAIVGSYSFLFFAKKIRVVMLLLLAFSSLGFFLSYTSLFPKANSIYTHYEYQPLMEYMKDEKRPIYLSSRFRDTKQYMFLLFYGRVLPADFQKNPTVIRQWEADGWIWVQQVSNWHFMKSLPNIEDLPADSLVIGATKEEIEPFVKQYKKCPGIQLQVKKTIFYLSGDPAFSVLEAERTGDLNCPTTMTL